MNDMKKTEIINKNPTDPCADFMCYRGRVAWCSACSEEKRGSCFERSTGSKAVIPDTPLKCVDQGV